MMTITFDITDEEADLIALLHGYNPEEASPTKKEFVNEQFKVSGRNMIVSQKLLELEESGKIAIETTKGEISF